MTVTLLDRLLGRACPLEGRVVALTGASGALGAALARALAARGATVLPLKHGVDWKDDDLSGADVALARADLLVLSHGAKEAGAMTANADTPVAFVQRYRRLRRAGGGAAEVWGVGSEIELHPAFGAQAYYDSKRAFARVARSLIHDRTFVYRHLVPAAFQSAMGPGPISADTAVRIALWWLDRGARYVPVTYTPFAFLNFFKFLLRWHAEAVEAYVKRRGLERLIDGP